MPSILEPAGMAREDVTIVRESFVGFFMFGATCYDIFVLTHIQETCSQTEAATDQAQLLKPKTSQVLLIVKLL